MSMKTSEVFRIDAEFFANYMCTMHNATLMGVGA